MVLSSAAIVALGVGLASVSALLLDDNALEGGTCATVCHHDLLGLVHNLGVVDTARARILLI